MTGAAPVTIMGDYDEVHAAVSNLIDNAVKYSGENVDVTVRTTAGRGRLRHAARAGSGSRHSARPN